MVDITLEAGFGECAIQVVTPNHSRDFKYQFISSILMITFTAGERVIRISEFMENPKSDNTTIWDRPEYQVFFYLR